MAAIAPGSPAAVAGLQAGDTLISVGGAPVASLRGGGTVNGALRRLAQDGVAVAFEIGRNGERLMVTLVSAVEIE